MKFPRFSADVKGELIHLFVGSASLQGFLFLLLDDGLSVFESGWQISLAVSLLYCLIPCAMVIVWALFLRSKKNAVLSADSGFGHLKYWQILIYSSTLLALGLTLHIFSEFESDLSPGFEKWSIRVTIAAGILVLIMVLIILYQTYKNRQRSHAIKDENIKVQFEKSLKSLNMEAMVVFLAISFGAVFVFQNTHVNPIEGHDHGKQPISERDSVKIDGSGEKKYNYRHSDLPKSNWDSFLKEKPLPTDSLISMLRRIDAVVMELETGRNYTKILFSNVSRTGASQSGQLLLIDKKLAWGNPTDTNEVASNISDIYLEEYGPNRSLTYRFNSAYQNDIDRLLKLTAARAHYFKSEWARQNQKPSSTVSIGDFNAQLKGEIEELKNLREIIKSDLKYHLKDKIMIIQFDVAVVLSVYFLIAMLLWYVFSLRSISLHAVDGSESNDSDTANNQASYFKNMSMYLIILFLPLLKFDAETTNVLDHPFWNITWSDVVDSGKTADAPDDGIDIHGPIVTTLDIEALMAKIEALDGGTGLTKNDLRDIEIALDKIEEDIRRIKQHQE